MVTSSSTNFFVLLYQCGQVLQGSFIKGIVGNSIFDLRIHNNCTTKVYILPRYRCVATNFTKVVLFEVALSDIWSDIW